MVKYIHSWSQYYRSNQEDPEEPEAGGTDLQALYRRFRLHEEV